MLQPAPPPAPPPDPAVAAAPHALVQPVAAEQHPAPPSGRPARSTRNPNPVCDKPFRRPQAQVAEVPALAPQRRLQAAADRNAARGEVRRVTFASPLVTAKQFVPGSGEPHSEEPRSGEPGGGELPNAEPSRRKRQIQYRLRQLCASRRCREARRAAAQAELNDAADTCTTSGFARSSRHCQCTFWQPGAVTCTCMISMVPGARQGRRLA